MGREGEGAGQGGDSNAKRPGREALCPGLQRQQALLGPMKLGHSHCCCSEAGSSGSGPGSGSGSGSGCGAGSSGGESPPPLSCFPPAPRCFLWCLRRPSVCKVSAAVSACEVNAAASPVVARACKRRLRRSPAPGWPAAWPVPLLLLLPLPSYSSQYSGHNPVLYSGHNPWMVKAFLQGTRAVGWVAKQVARRQESRPAALHPSRC
jgi:hypothetical protein